MTTNDLRDHAASSRPRGDHHGAMAEAGSVASFAAAAGLDHVFGPDQRDRLLRDLTEDPLTGLPNRVSFQRLATSAIAGAPVVALVLIDLDHFKLINDGLGHDHGDALLAEVGRRFRGVCREDALLARIGGDSFTVLLRSDRPLGDATAALAARLRDSLQAPLELGGRNWSMSCSVGIAHADCIGLSRGNGGRPSVGDLLRDAEVAMYRAKKEGRDRAVVFDPAMHAATVARLNLEADLHAALDRKEFVLQLQPIVRLADDRLKGFEALARWERDGELVLPGGFMSVLEDTGLVIPFGYQVIREACAILRDWTRRFPGSDLPSLNVNLSARQFEDPALFDTICAIVAESGVSPGSLRFEIIESLLMQNPEHVADVLGRLAGRGFGISLDDFGTGFSSLGYLQSFPVDSLKIDRSFVARMGDEGGNLRIVRAILGLAASLGLSVVAEGIETAAQATLLRKLGCEYGQGYHFGRPVSVAEATDLFEQSQSPRTRANAWARSAADGARAAAPTFAPGRASHPAGEPEDAPVGQRHGAGSFAHRRRFFGGRPRGIETGNDGASQEGASRAGVGATAASPALGAARAFAPLLLVSLFMALHAALILALPAHKNTLSSLCLTVSPAAASWACWRAARTTGAGLRVNWAIAALGFLFWASGSLVAIWLPMLGTAGVVDFAYFLGSTSLMFAMTTPDDDQPRWLFLLMDSIQALLGACLGYIVIFGAVPFTSDRVVPLGETATLWVYDVEHLCMAIVACLRLLGSDGSPDRRRFDIAFVVFTLSFGATGSLYDHIAPADASVLDVMLLDPAFFLIACVVGRQTRAAGAGTREVTPSIAFLNSVGPAFLTAAVLIVAAWIARQSLVPGIVGIVATVSIYALRVSLLQARYVVTQQHLQRTRDRLESLALEDGLTRVGNRRAFDTTLAAMWSRAEQAGSPLSVLLVDVDFFKAYNDRHGHLAGDACLARVAAELDAVVAGQGGFVARYGGEEFAVLLPHASAPARLAASTIREAVAALDLRSHAGAPAPVTVSIGVATSTPAGSSNALILAADDALYRAKRRGRDRVEVERLDALEVA